MDSQAGCCNVPGVIKVFLRKHWICGPEILAKNISKMPIVSSLLLVSAFLVACGDKSTAANVPHFVNQSANFL